MDKLQPVLDGLAKRTPTDPDTLNKAVEAVYAKYPNGVRKYDKLELADGNIQLSESREHKKFRMEVMKAALRNPIALMGKSAISTGSNIFGYDLQAPSHHLVPFLSPIRERLARVHRGLSSTVAHWKQIDNTTFNRGGMPASPWINEGQRAPQISLSATDRNVPYVSLGVDGAVTFEEVSSSEGFEDALATEAFFRLETLMLKEEDAIIGGNATLKLGTANTPAGTSGTDMYVAVVGLTYEGYRNFQLLGGISNGLVQTLNTTTADGKAMQVNSGSGILSAISAHLDKTHDVTVTEKSGEVAYVWYVGTSASAGAMFITALTTQPVLPANTVVTVPSTGQLASLLASTDYSVNDGTQGGGAAQVKAFDGLLTQAFNSASAYVAKLSGAKLTASGFGGVVEIDTMLADRWNNFNVSVDVIYVNAQELKNITKAVLSAGTGASPASLLRYNESANGGNYDLVASGTISQYFNPYMPGGGKKIPIMVHPTLSPGTILGWSDSLPPYFKTNNTPAVAEMLTRRDYYAQEYAITTREYQFGVYCEEALAVYALFGLAVITGIRDGLN